MVDEQIDDVQLVIDDSVEPLLGKNPVVLLGPNGAGKSRLGVRLTQSHRASRISAVRNIVLPDDLPMRALRQANQQLTNQLNAVGERPWETSNEINNLFSKLMAEDAASAVRFRDESLVNKSATPEQTALMTLSSVWHDLYPGRSIDFSGHQPRVKSDHTGTADEYSAGHMSDGERVALYLAGRVLDAHTQMIIVDEPEVHFHSRLAARFWDRMENLRSDCRFVYITHDLPFALSREDATFVIVMPDMPPQVVDLVDGLPAELAECLLAAASFSIYADRIIFCEGKESGLDKAVYSAWFNSQKAAVIPVGSSTNVIRSTLAFAESTLVAGVTAQGIIDRDYWPDEFIGSMKPEVKVLDVHEIEILLCLRGVLTAVAKYQGKSSVEAESLYEQFLNGARSSFESGLLNKQISERFRRRCENQFEVASNGMEVTDDLESTKRCHVESLDPAGWGIDPGDLFDQEQKTIQEALAGTEEDFFRYLPGKGFLPLAARSLGMDRKAYVNLVCRGLDADEGEPLHHLGVELDTTLTNYLPPRV